MKNVRREGGIQLIWSKVYRTCMEKGQTSMHTQREKEFNWDEVEKIRTRKKKNRKFWWVSTWNWFHNDDNEKTKEKFTEILSSLYDLRTLEKINIFFLHLLLIIIIIMSPLSFFLFRSNNYFFSNFDLILIKNGILLKTGFHFDSVGLRKSRRGKSFKSNPHPSTFELDADLRDVGTDGDSQPKLLARDGA